MRKLLLATVAVVAVSAPARAEVKRDILGFQPGMSYQEAIRAATKICKGKIESGSGVSGIGTLPNRPSSPALYVICSPGSREILQEPYAGPPNPEQELLDLRFAPNLSERPLIAVGYWFQTRLLTSDLVRSIFEQFGVPCDLRKSGRDEEPLCYPAHNGDYDWVMVDLLLDPPDQKYTSDVPGLWLYLRKSRYSAGYLALMDTRIAEADKAGYQANNPPPKF